MMSEDQPRKSGRIIKQLEIFFTVFVISTAGLWLTGDWLIIATVLKENTTSVLKSVFQNDTQVFRNILVNVLWSLVPTILIYWVFCEFLQWKYYTKQRDRPQDWKCQPRNFLSEEDERHEMYLGFFSLSIASVLSGLISWHIENGGHTRLYAKIEDYGWVYFFSSIVVHFLIIEFFLYWAHRVLHYPFFYKTIHKIHHRYKQPTAYSFSAMHPVEMITYQSIAIGPTFFIPTHWAAFMIIVSYSFYYGVLSHSGIKFSSFWPWQVPTTFHDNHHQYFHCNFGFNMELCDKLWGTLREKDRVYNEKTFFGRGKLIEEADQEEIREHEYNIKDD